MDVIPWTAAFTIHLLMRTVFRTETQFGRVAFDQIPMEHLFE